MNIFEQAKTRADDVAPAPADKPITAGLTAVGFGLLVTGIYIALVWCGLPAWMAWIGSALIYGAIGYGDSLIGWSRHKREFHEALDDLKAQSGMSVH